MSHLWVLVAESSRAKLYRSNGRMAPLTEIEDLLDPEGRMHEGDLVSDRAGSDGGSVGQGRHVFDQQTTASRQVHAEFARILASHLTEAHNAGSFDELILVAPPEFLGLLRENLSKPVRERVVQEVDKNLVQLPADAVREHLIGA